MHTEATEKILQCDYDIPIIDRSIYVKYRVVLQDDGTIIQSMPQNGSEEYKEGDSIPWNEDKTNFYPTTFKVSDNTAYSSLPMTQSSFTAKYVKDYYEENNSCPTSVFAINGTSYIIFPAEDTSLNDGINYWSVEGTTTFFDENEEPVEEEKPEMTTVCSYQELKIDDVPSVNIEFQMYNDGEKYFKFYFTDRGENTAQIAKVNNGADTVINAVKDSGGNYTIYLPADEIENVFLQNSEQKDNNVFTCPDKEKIWLIEEAGIQAGYYKITTDAEEAKEYYYKTDFRGDTYVDWPFDANSCNSILGEISNNNSPAHYLDFAFKIIKYAAIVILFVFTIIDFTKAIAASKDDAIKKATQNAIKRLVIAIIIFFLPYLIIFILDILGIVTNNPTCGIGV